uniref:Uncharacterized protein LOC117359821 n=1 Tax=Geotrypetes seraphini TaxID=260995 RepID=A0A6P8QKA2_GEOSA|nr:uncharacterized protein LOC117359821 [Geotrypetes seraphini]
MPQKKGSKRRSWRSHIPPQNVQEMFFSPRILSSQKSLQQLADLKEAGFEDRHWHVPFKAVSGDTATLIKTHLKDHLHHHHARRMDRSSKEEELFEENLYLRECTQSFMLGSRKNGGDADLDHTGPPIDLQDNSLIDSMVKEQVALTMSLTDVQRDTNIDIILGLPTADDTSWPENLEAGVCQENSKPNTNALTSSLRELAALSDEAAKPKHNARLMPGNNTSIIAADMKEESPGQAKRLDSSVVETVLPRSQNKFDLENNEFQVLCQGGDTEENVIRGHVNIPCSPKKKVFEVYICGGYRDSKAERGVLFEKAYPELYTYCKQRGFDFRMYDLRWGLSDGVSNDHRLVSIHLNTLKQCQESGHSHFFFFIGQKHDYPVVPVILSKADFEAIKGVMERMRRKALKQKISSSLTHSIRIDEPSMNMKVDKSLNYNQATITSNIPANENDSDLQTSIADAKCSSKTESGLDSDENDYAATSQVKPNKSAIKYDKEIDLLSQWYRRDENCVPNVYKLQPLSTVYADVFSKDPVRRQQAKNKWLLSLHNLLNIFQEYTPVALGEKATAELLKTVLQRELDQGLQVQGAPEDHCHGFKRAITDLQYNLSNEKSSDYIDILPLKPEINMDLYQAHQDFIESIHTRLRHTNIFEYNVSWGSDGINPTSNRSHAYYLQRLSNDFQRTVIIQFNRMISSQNFLKIPDAWRRKHLFRTRNNEEILQHVQYCQTLVSSFTGRETFLHELRTNVQRYNRRLIVVHGEAGSGKSAIMAKTVSSTTNWIAGDLRVVIRFIGVTGDSRNVRLLLQNLCYQVAEIYNISTTFSEDIKGLKNEFCTLLEFASEARPLLISLDGLDELSKEHNSDISWIPAELPPHVYFIVSTSTDTDCSYLETLQKCTVEQNVFSIPPLTSTEIKEIFGNWLVRDCRRLPCHQMRVLVEACTACPLSLYMLCAYRESCLWTSYSSDTEVFLPPDLSSIYSRMLGRMEKNHGKVFVKKAAAYITISRNGITLEELLGLLSADQAVIQEVKQYQMITVVTFPYVLWAKLQEDLGTDLVEHRTDSTYVFSWSHSSLRSACLERYLKEQESQLSIHTTIADYYLGSGHYEDSRKCKNTLIFQPLAWVLQQDSRISYVFNLRKLHGTSYHLILSNQIPRLLTECLFNYEFLLHKAWASSVISIEEDLNAALSSNSPMPDLNLLTEVLKLSKNVLLKDPCQLASQLVGRLHQIIATDKPVAPGDPRKYTYFPALLSQCQQSSISVLVPSSSCLLTPGGLLCDFLAGHMDQITAVAEAEGDLLTVTTSKDGTLKLWDLHTGRATFTLYGIGKNIDSITMCLENKIAAVTEGNSLQIWDLSKENLIYTANGLPDIPILTSAMDGKLLLAFFDGSHLVKVFNLANSCKLLHEVTILAGYTPVHKDNSILVSKNSVKDYVVFAYRSGKEAMVFNAKTGVVIAKLTAQDPVASVQGVAVTKEFFLVICRYPSMKFHDLIHIELFSVQTFAYLRSVKGCCNDFISTFSVNRLGSHLVAFSPLPNTNTTEIVVWNLETEDHKHITKFSSVLSGGVCFDLRYCLGFCEGENGLRIWNLASKINDHSLSVSMGRGKQTDGIQELITMKNYPRYVVCRTMKLGVVSVWNIVKSKCKSSAVRVERGLMENTDVVLIRDMKLFILTDRVMGSFAGIPRPIFQTLLTYDLLKKRYVKRQTGLYIIPCPKHEYRILEGGFLLGLSENRDHFVIWNLETGFVKDRIRPEYKNKHSQLPDHHTYNNDVYKDINSNKKQKEEKVLQTPWERRNETKTAKKRRKEAHRKQETEKLQRLSDEKSNAIDQYLLSGDEKIIVCSYYAHHMSVFSLETLSQLHILETRASMLFLHYAALTYTGSFLVLSNYNDDEKISYLTLWDLGNGRVKKRLKNEPNVCSIAITDDASRIVFGVLVDNRLKVWDPFRSWHKSIPGYEGLCLSMNSDLQVTEGGAKAILLAGEVSLWDLNNGRVISVFTPDSTICYLSLALDRTTVLLCMSDSSALITLKITGKKESLISEGKDLFGEESTSSEEEPDEPEKI